MGIGFERPKASVIEAIERRGAGDSDAGQRGRGSGLLDVQHRRFHVEIAEPVRQDGVSEAELGTVVELDGCVDSLAVDERAVSALEVFEQSRLSRDRDSCVLSGD